MNPSKCDHSWLTHVEPNVCFFCGIPRARTTLNPNRPRLPARRNDDPPRAARTRMYFNRTGRR